MRSLIVLAALLAIPFVIGTAVGFSPESGDEVFAFQDALARTFGGKHCIALANGSLALELPLRAFGIGPGDEVGHRLEVGGDGREGRDVGAVAQVLVEGTPEDVAADPDSFTGQFLAPVLEKARAGTPAPRPSVSGGVGRDRGTKAPVVKVTAATKKAAPTKKAAAKPAKAAAKKAAPRRRSA